MLTVVLVVAALVLAATAQPTWVSQTVYRNANGCTLQAIGTTTAWRAGYCSQVSPNVQQWGMRTCNSSYVLQWTCTTSDCASNSCNVTASYAAGVCGRMTNPSNNYSYGVYFGCTQQTNPPVLSPQNNAVYTHYLYKGYSLGGGCNTQSVIQSVSAVSGVCISGDSYTCNFGGAQPSAQWTTQCNTSSAATSSVALNSCTGQATLQQSICQQAVDPTPTPSDPNNPTGANPNSVTACETATTLLQCTGGANTTAGLPTLPPTGLLNKCCVWCGNGDGTGQCRTPSFSTKACNCPVEGTYNFSQAVQAYQCNAATATQVSCMCTGKSPGVPSCLAAGSAVTASLLVLALIVMSTFTLL